MFLYRLNQKYYMPKTKVGERQILGVSALALLLLFAVPSFTGFAVQGNIFSTIKNAFGTQSASGTVSFASTPSGANVYVDGALKGVTPLSVPGLPVGSHTVRISKSGYDDYTGSVTVVSGQTKAVSRTLSISSAKAQTQTASNTNSQRTTAQNANALVANPELPERQINITELKNRIQNSRGSKAARWRAIIPEIRNFGSVTPSQNHFGFSGYHTEISVANLGSPVKVCWAYIYGANANLDYYGCTTNDVETYRTTESPSQIDYSCPTGSWYEGVPCNGYIIVYSEDNRQPILPGGVLCDDKDETENDQTNVCVTLNFVRETDLF